MRKKYFLKKTTQSCVEKKNFKKNYTTLCGKNFLKKNPHRLYGVLIYLIIKIVSCIFQEGDYEKGWENNVSSCFSCLCFCF